MSPAPPDDRRAVGVAAVGSIYLALATPPGGAAAAHAFASTSLALGAVALLAAAADYLTTHLHTTHEQRRQGAS